MNIEKVGQPKDVFVTCPQCRELFYISREFYEPQFNKIPLHCPFCHKEFFKEDSPQRWGE